MTAAEVPTRRLASLDRWTSGVVVCTVAAIAVAPATIQARWAWLAAFAVVFAVAAVLAARSSGAVPRRAVVFCGCLFLLYAAGGALGMPPALTTLLVCVVPLVALLGSHRLLGDAPAAPWFTAGHRPGPLTLALAVVTIVLAAAALSAWAIVVRPDPPAFLEQIAGLPLWLGLLGVLAFALVNPVWEEALFRGVLLEDLREVGGPVVGVVGQAGLFGLAHYSAGFPSGWFGATMAAVWGGVLGVIRLRTGGIALPYVVHVGANLAIGLLAMLLLS